MHNSKQREPAPKSITLQYHRKVIVRKRFGCIARNSPNIRGAREKKLHPWRGEALKRERDTARIGVLGLCHHHNILTTISLFAI